jgi:hypothetical protein
VVNLTFAAWVSCYLISILVEKSWPMQSGKVAWFADLASAIRYACALMAASAIVFVALRTASRQRRTALLVAGTVLLLHLLLHVSIMAYRALGHFSIETIVFGFRVEFGLRLVGVVAMGIAVWPRARIAAALALSAQGFFALDMFHVAWLREFRFSPTGEWVSDALAVTSMVAMAVMIRTAAGDLRCDSEPLLRRSYHALAVAMGLRVVLAAVVAFGVLLGLGDGSPLLRWLLPLSLGGAWVINLLVLVAAVRLVFAATGESLRLAIAAGMLICVSFLQIPILGELWQALHGRSYPTHSAAVLQFRYAIPLLTLLGTWGLISVVYRVANQRGQNEVAEATFASGVMFFVVSVAGFASQLALSEVRTRGQAIGALAISVGCALAAVVLLLRLFQRARDALPTTTELPSAIARPTQV